MIALLSSYSYVSLGLVSVQNGRGWGKVVVDGGLRWLSRGIRRFRGGDNGRPTELLAVGDPQFSPGSEAYKLVTF